MAGAASACSTAGRASLVGAATGCSAAGANGCCLLAPTAAASAPKTAVWTYPRAPPLRSLSQARCVRTKQQLLSHDPADHYRDDISSDCTTATLCLLLLLMHCCSLVLQKMLLLRLLILCLLKMLLLTTTKRKINSEDVALILMAPCINVAQ